jgi:hypothetical protein
MDPILSSLGLETWNSEKLRKKEMRNIYRFHYWIYHTVSKTTTVDFPAAYISCVRIVLCTRCHVQNAMEQYSECLHTLMEQQSHIAIDKHLQGWDLVSVVHCPDRSIDQGSSNLNFDRSTKMERRSAMTQVQILWIFTVYSTKEILVSTWLLILMF